jgi:hypothetical protein
MTERYFDKFQTITYANTAVRNITQRAVVLSSIYNNPALYYPYDIEQGERPDNIADRYYKDQYKSWILHLTNNVVDPYHDWYLDEATFQQFISKKYGSLANATSKVKFYRNNWYTDTNTISIAAYNALDGSLKSFYQPLYADPELSTRLLGYIRKQEDWKKTTNKIVSYNTDGTDFIYDEIVNVFCGESLIGTGQVCARTSTTTTLQHITGSAANEICLGVFSLVGRESKNVRTYSTVTVVVDNIPAIQTDYWEPVYYYDYENEINERNKSIRVLDAQYSSQISKELKSLLR